MEMILNVCFLGLKTYPCARSHSTHTSWAAQEEDILTTSLRFVCATHKLLETKLCEQAQLAKLLVTSAPYIMYSVKKPSRTGTVLLGRECCRTGRRGIQIQLLTLKRGRNNQVRFQSFYRLGDFSLQSQQIFNFGLQHGLANGKAAIPLYPGAYSRIHSSGGRWKHRQSPWNVWELPRSSF